MSRKIPLLCQGVAVGKKFHAYLGRASGKEAVRPQLTVHSVFRRVVNLSGEGSLFSLVTPGVGKSAGCLVVDLPANLCFNRLGIKRGMVVKYSDGRLLAGDLLAVDCRRAALWPGRESSDLIWRGNELSLPNLEIFHQAILRRGEERGLSSLLYRSDHPLAGRLNILAEGLIGPKTELLAEAVLSLLGLGPGLTPSGDDLLLGLLAAVGTGDDYRSVKKEFSGVIAQKLERTNDLSAHFLQEAIQGNYHEYLQELIYACGHGPSSEVFRTISTLLGVGATSGSDIATGLYLGFYWAYRKSRLPTRRFV